MNYQIKKGVAVFQIRDSFFIYPSQSAQTPISCIIPLSQELFILLQSGTLDPDSGSFSQETREKIKRLLTFGYLEEC
jgi:hypothetical protein